MSRAQGLPVNMIVLTALALLVLVVVGAFFISGFGQATGSIQVVDASEADCQSMCQGLATSAFNYRSCNELATNPLYNDCGSPPSGYGVECASQYGACTVTIMGGDQCRCGATDCQEI